MNINPYAIPGLRRDTLTVEVIQAIVSNYFKISVEELMSKNRKAEYVKARQMAYFFIRLYLKLTKTEISKAFHSDHSTIIYALKRCDFLLWNEREFRYDYEEIDAKLKEYRIG